jgi:hypothetical protein
MPWFKVDDSFHSHPKVLRAGTAAAGLYVRCGSYSAQHLTDGFVPAEVAAQYGSPEWARRLVVVGLWVIVDGGYQMPDYLQYNPSKAKVLKDREAKAARQQRWRDSKKTGKGGRRVTNASRDASRDASPPHPEGSGVGGGPSGPPAPTPTLRVVPDVCERHLQQQPCISCAADRKAANQ